MDSIILDFAFQAQHHADFHPANAGDVSQVLSAEITRKCVQLFRRKASDWFPLSQLDRLGTIRRDGRTGYRSQGVRDPQLRELAVALAGRVILVTTTGSQIPALAHSLAAGCGGRFLNLLEVDGEGSSIRILYGNREYGTIPSIETHIHIAANAIGVETGLSAPATVHAHPPALVALGRHPAIAGSFESLNAAAYTQVEGLLRNYPDLIGVVPYVESGTEELVLATLPVLRRHRIVLWMNHGCVVRAENIGRAYTLLAYAEVAATASLDWLSSGSVGLPESTVRSFLEVTNLWESFRAMKRRPG